MLKIVHLRRTRPVQLLLVTLSLAIFALTFIGSAPTPARAVAAGYLSTSGRYIVNSAGQAVRLNGINWFGFEDQAFVPHGLNVQSYTFLLDKVKSMGFNVIRLPYSDSLWPSQTPNSAFLNTGIGTNSALAGKTSLQVMDAIINYGGSIGLKFILDRHRPTYNGQSETPLHPSCDKVTCWHQHMKDLANRYKDATYIANYKAVIGIDIHNEPHGISCWGCGLTDRDWKLFAKDAAEAILDVNPNLLIFVEGIEKTAAGENYWWGGNLKEVGASMLTLSTAARTAQIVYSAHDYPNSIWPYDGGANGQKWFRPTTASPAGTWTCTSTPYATSCGDHLPGVWNSFWGYLMFTNATKKPVLLGEFGTKLIDPKDVVWYDQITSYICTNQINYTFWDLNPDSDDTGGMLQSDWSTVETNKLSKLSGCMAGMIDSQGGGTTPTNTPTRTNTPIGPTATPTNTPTGGGGTGTLKVQYKAADINASTQGPKPHFIIVNTGSTAVALSTLKIRYYFTKDTAPTTPFTTYCDWANIGCGNVTHSTAALSPIKTGADYYIEVGFGTSAGSVAANGNTGEIQIRMSAANWQNFTQTGDYSFDATKTAFADWNKVVLLQNGTVVWGLVP